MTIALGIPFTSRIYSSLFHWYHGDVEFYAEEMMNRDGDRYFGSKVLEAARTQEEGSRDILIYLAPADFLSVAMSGFNPDKEAAVKAVFDSGVEFNEVPFLNFVHDGEGTATVTGHEGRHRAMLLQLEGVKEMPVLLRHRYDPNGHAIVWDRVMSDPKSFVDGWPEKLYGERGDSPETRLNWRNSIHFPIQDPRIEHIPDQECSSKPESEEAKPKSRFRP